MVGEIRDAETAQNAVQAALTGHLVFSTLHTVDAAGAVTRLFDLGVPPFLLTSTLVGVVAQRLLRKVCEACAEDVTLAADERRILNLPAAASPAPPLPVRRGAGCQECRHTGLKGRTGIFELLNVNDRVRQLIAARADAIQLARAAVEDGMMPLREGATRKLIAGITSYEEVLRVTADLR
jgi:general secretion pathway protein E